MQTPRRTRRWVLRTTGAAVAGAAVIGSASADEHIIREEAVLTDEAHGLDTGASGLATFEVDVEAEEIHYTVHIDEICDPNQAHVHVGGPDEDGPVVAWLYPEDVREPRIIEGLFQGTLAEGTTTPEDFVGPIEGMSLEEAGALLQEEGAYVNVHTDEHPGGEIRGQIEVVDAEEGDEPPEEEPEDEGDERDEPDDEEGDEYEDEEPEEHDDDDEDEYEDDEETSLIQFVLSLFRSLFV
ncbi:CHRD domain-containing protein [Natronorarus salvus]|uniref:CHRD domain-containing protein n=1 Tax=Natronorarus salvus TaxID=3117733 RepID=UPI002F26975A